MVFGGPRTVWRYVCVSSLGTMKADGNKGLQGDIQGARALISASKVSIIAKPLTVLITINCGKF